MASSSFEPYTSQLLFANADQALWSGERQKATLPGKRRETSSYALEVKQNLNPRSEGARLAKQGELLIVILGTADPWLQT